MSCYPLPLDARSLADGKLRMLLADFKFQSDRYKKTITAKMGFVYNGTSTPKQLWRWLGSPFVGFQRFGAVIHDWLYSHGAEEGISRKEADGIFYEAMICSGKNACTAWLIYRGVRAFGKNSYLTGNE